MRLDTVSEPKDAGENGCKKILNFFELPDPSSPPFPSLFPAGVVVLVAHVIRRSDVRDTSICTTNESNHCRHSYL